MTDCRNIPDTELVALLKNDNHAAFTELYNRYWKLLFYVAFKRLEVYDEAEEVVQDVFTDIWSRRTTLIIHTSFKYYLATATQYQVMNRMAKMNRRLEAVRLSAKNETTDQLPADQRLLFQELEAQINSLVKELPEKCSLVYQLSRHDGLTNKEIAARLDISEKTVENQITKALARIRKGLGRKSFFSQPSISAKNSLFKIYFSFA